MVKKIVLVLFGLLLLFSFFGCSGSPSDNIPNEGTGAQSEAVEEPEKADLELIDAQAVTGDYGVRSIVGTVKNNTDKEYSYVQIEINLYDDSGAQVGSTLANANNLEPGGTWKFEAVILEDNATEFKVKEITGF